MILRTVIFQLLAFVVAHRRISRLHHPEDIVKPSAVTYGVHHGKDKFHRGILQNPPFAVDKQRNFISVKDPAKNRSSDLRIIADDDDIPITQSFFSDQFRDPHRRCLRLCVKIAADRQIHPGRGDVSSVFFRYSVFLIRNLSPFCHLSQSFSHTLKYRELSLCISVVASKDNIDFRCGTGDSFYHGKQLRRHIVEAVDPEPVRLYQFRTADLFRHDAEKIFGIEVTAGEKFLIFLVNLSHI